MPSSLLKIIYSILFLFGLANILYCHRLSENLIDDQSNYSTNNQISTWTIIPGKGIDKLKLGMPYSDVVNILGNFKETRKLSASKHIYKNSGYDSEKLLFYYVGSDIELEYDQSTISQLNPYPVFKVFFKDSKLVYIILSNYVHDSPSSLRFAINKQLRFLDSKEKMLKVMGENFYKDVMKGYDGDYYYFDKGISFILDDEQKIQVINLFQPITGSKKKFFLDRLQTIQSPENKTMSNN